MDTALWALRGGDLVILPTETVYGLAADAANPTAVARIYEAKGRPSFNPLISHVADLETAERLAVLDDRARALAQAFWPGPLTIVAPFRQRAPICDLARAGLDTVALRVPSHPLALELLRAFGGAVAAPSANRSGRPSPTTFADALEETGVSAAAGLDGGACTVGLESTVIAVLGSDIQLLRPGGIERTAIEAVVGPLGGVHADAHRSPGRLALHYAPKAPVRLEVTTPEPDEAFLAFGACARVEAVWNLSPLGDLREAAANLFAYLRAADRTAPRAIAVGPVPQHGLGEAINDRLRRAAGFVG
jgi:L-threonylcarbamoyladenylate synthase